MWVCLWSACCPRKNYPRIRGRCLLELEQSSRWRKVIRGRSVGWDQGGREGFHGCRARDRLGNWIWVMERQEVCR